jgi:hypothetical protein
MRIVNNTFVGTHSTYTYRGLYGVGGGQNTVLNNSVYIENSYNSSTYAALYYPSSSWAEVSDYNNIYTTGYVGYLSGGYNTLTAWQTATGMDTNSFDVDPGYSSDFDSLRTCDSTLDGHAMPLDYITDDFEGDDRSPTPDIGADEYIGPDQSLFSAGDDFLICSDNPVIIGPALSAANFDSLYWTGITGPVQTTPQIAVTKAGTYTLNLIATCADSGDVWSDDVVVTDVTITPDFDILKNWQTGVFTNTSTHDSTIMWVVHTNPADTFYDKDQLTYLFPTLDGEYQVDLYVMNDCETKVISKNWATNIGVEDVNLSQKISVMPNPVSDVLTIQFNGIEGDVTVEMMNIQGQMVHSDRYMNVNGASKTINVSSLKKGMYIVKFITNSDIATKQIIVK